MTLVESNRSKTKNVSRLKGECGRVNGSEERMKGKKIEVGSDGGLAGKKKDQRHVGKQNESDGRMSHKRSYADVLNGKYTV